MLTLLEALLAAFARGEPVAFTALVETRGSTPQKAGATMLVFADGSQVGTLGGDREQSPSSRHKQKWRGHLRQAATADVAPQ